MADQLTKQEKVQLEQWIGDGAKTFELIYSINRDGCSPATFHQLCNNKGPTITVLYNKDGSVFGGYASVSWKSAGGYQIDYNSFMFTLRYNGRTKYKKFPLKVGTYAIYDNVGYGPTFGGGGAFDLVTFTAVANKSGNCFTLNGSMTLNNAYDSCGVQVQEINNGHMQFTELEVFKVTDGPKLELEEPWRSTPEWNYDYRMYQVRSAASSKPLPFRLCDTRGLEEGQGLDAYEISFMIDGNVPEGYQFNPSVPFSRETPGYIKTPSLKDMIHCVAFVLDGSTVDVLQEKTLERMKAMQTKMNQIGVPQVVLLTKVDKVCRNVEEDLTIIFKSGLISSLVDKVSQVMGLPRGHVLPLKNYEKELELDINVSILSLLALRQILRFSQDFLFNFLDNPDRLGISKLEMKE